MIRSQVQECHFLDCTFSSVETFNALWTGRVTKLALIWELVALVIELRRRRVIRRSQKGPEYLCVREKLDKPVKVVYLSAGEGWSKAKLSLHSHLLS